MSAKRVLLVDDEREILEVLREALEGSGYEVATAADGEQGMALLSSFKPHAVVLDVIMPKENGYRVSRMIKSAEVDSPEEIPRVILLTGRRLAEHPEREELFQQFSMADTVMYKPVDLPEFVRQVDAILAAGAPATPAPASAAGVVAD